MNVEAGAVHQDPTKARAILEAALHEFASRGYREADVQAVADRAGVGKGTVYRYFQSKEGLFQAVAHAGMQELERDFRALLEVDLPFLERARRMAAAYAAFYQSHPEYVEILIQERAEFRGSVPDTLAFYRERNREGIESLLQGAVDDGTLRPVDVARTSTAVIDALWGTVVRGVIEGRVDRLTDDVAYTFDLLMNGLRA